MASKNWTLALIALTTAVVVTIYAKGLLKLIPIFAGIIIAYISAYFMGKLDFTGIQEAAWFALPKFVTPEVSWKAVLYMMPVAIAPVIEHIGDIYVVNTVAGKDFVKDPGLHRTMLGDGVACLVSSFLGGPPETTYSEVTGAMALTKITNPQVIRIAAVTGILFSVIGKVSAFLRSIPESVLGGIMLLLFGTIACAGVSNLIKHRVDFQDTRNTVIASLILTIGIGGAQLSIGSFSMAGIGLASLIGVLLNLIIPKIKN
jgi:uracil permease